MIAWSHLRFTLIQIGRTPIRSAMLVFILAIGIGATTAVYSTIDGLFLNPLPAKLGSGLIRISERYDPADDLTPFDGVSSVVLEGLREHAAPFETLAWHKNVRWKRPTRDFMQNTLVTLVSPEFFTLYQISPHIGRLPSRDEALPLTSAHQIAEPGGVILSYQAWQRHFDQNPKVIGEPFHLESVTHTVVAVLPAWFQYPSPTTEAFLVVQDPKSQRGVIESSDYLVVARKNPDTPDATVTTRLETLARQLSTQHNGSRGYNHHWQSRPAGLQLQAHPLQDYLPLRAKRNQTYYYSALAGSGLLLTMICVTCAISTSIRNRYRASELAIRTALGASRTQLAIQLLTECLVLSTAAAGLGLFVASWGMDLLEAYRNPTVPRFREVMLDGRLFAVATLLALACTLIFGLLPSLLTARQSSLTSLNLESRQATQPGKQRYFIGALVSLEIATAFCLLSATGVLLRSVDQQLNADPGYDRKPLLQVDIDLPRQSYQPPGKPTEAERTVQQIHQQLQQLPGVASVGLETHLAHSFVTEDTESQLQGTVRFRGCGVGDSDPFAARELPLLQGRALKASDVPPRSDSQKKRGERLQNVLVNESLANHFWPNQSPLGNLLRIANSNRPTRYRVVGVVPDPERIHTATKQSIIYCPYTELPSGARTPYLIVRSHTTDRTALINAIWKRLLNTEPNMGTPAITPLTTIVENNTAADRTLLFYLAILGGLSLLLACIGLHAILAESVLQRSHEFGVRLALGASRKQILTLALRHGSTLIAIGLIAGMVAALGTNQLIESHLFNVSPSDPVTILTLIVVFLLIGITASIGPSLHVLRQSPLDSIHLR